MKKVGILFVLLSALSFSANSAKTVKTTKGYENWEADYSPESLKMLGKWFEENVETEKLSEEEYKEKRATVPDYIEIQDWDITIKTRSLAVGIGIYFGEWEFVEDLLRFLHFRLKRIT